MTRETWERAKAEIGNELFTLGPYFAFQALHNPRHFLFTLARYKFAARMLPLDRHVHVLELGCGEGLGTLLLADGGHRVMGVDFDGEAISHARESIRNPDIEFVCKDFIGQVLGSFHAVVSLDVIEHIPQAQEDLFVRTVCDNLTAEGFAVIGTPNESAKQYASRASEIGHVNLFTGQRLASLMGKYFTNVFAFGMNDEMVHTGFLPMSHYLIVLCCGKITKE